MYIQGYVTKGHLKSKPRRHQWRPGIVATQIIVEHICRDRIHRHYTTGLVVSDFTGMNIQSSIFKDSCLKKILLCTQRLNRLTLQHPFMRSRFKHLLTLGGKKRTTFRRRISMSAQNPLPICPQCQHIASF